MQAIGLKVHGLGRGVCPISGHEEDGVTVSFEDGTIVQTFVAWEGLERLLRLKANGRDARNGKSK